VSGSLTAKKFPGSFLPALVLLSFVMMMLEELAGMKNA
jgi:hypothetical protein